MPTDINQVIAVVNTWGAIFTALAWPMLWQSMAATAVLLILVWAGRRVRAVLRYALLMLVLIKVLLPPSLSLPTSLAYWWPVSESPLPNEAHIPVLSTELPTTQSAVAGVTISNPGIVLLVWIAGLVTLSAYILVRYRRLSRLENLSAPAELEELVDSCRRELGLRRSLPLRISAACSSPAVCGLFRPMVLIPRVLADRLSLSQLRHVLLHELIHVKRRDLWVNHLQVVLQVFYWYNPLLWLANAVIRRVREEAVDETVTVALGQGAQSYPETLVAVAKLVVSRPSWNLGLIGIIEPKAALKQRLTRLIESPARRTAKVGWINSGLILILAGVLLPMAHPQSRTENATQRTTSKDTGQILQPTDNRPADVLVSDNDIDKELVQEFENSGYAVDRAALLRMLQTQGLTFEQYRQKLHDQLAQSDSKALGFDWFLGNKLMSGGRSRSAAVDPSRSNIVAKIVIHHIGPTAVSDERIKAKIGAKVGAPIAPADVDSDVRNLYATGLFHNIRVTQERSAEGTTLTYVVQEKPVLSKISFDGNARFGERVLKEKVTSRVGSPLDERMLFNDAQRLEEHYRASGCPGTVVKYKISLDQQTGRASVTFEVSEKGPTAGIRSSTNGKPTLVLTNGENVSLWELNNEQVLHAGALRVSTSRAIAAVSVPALESFGDSGEAAATGGKEGRLEARAKQCSLQHTVAFSPDGHWVITRAEGDKARVWDIATEEGTNGGSSVVFSPDGTWMVNGTNLTLRAWDASKANAEPK
jgi:beta-lactamase regulating signal transducer with metallopeptidase domain